MSIWFCPPPIRKLPNGRLKRIIFQPKTLQWLDSFWKKTSLPYLTTAMYTTVPLIVYCAFVNAEHLTSNWQLYFVVVVKDNFRELLLWRSKRRRYYLLKPIKALHKLFIFIRNFFFCEKCNCHVNPTRSSLCRSEILWYMCFLSISPYPTLNGCNILWADIGKQKNTDTDWYLSALGSGKVFLIDHLSSHFSHSSSVSVTILYPTPVGEKGQWELSAVSFAASLGNSDRE